MAFGPDTAWHYEAYRPPLHPIILDHALPKGQHFHRALDVGCGAGHSAVALWEHAVQVTGQEVNMNMIREAEHHASGNLEFTNRPLRELTETSPGDFDLITFAGSLFYQDAGEVWSQVRRLAASRAYVCVYDFEVPLRPVFDRLGLTMPESHYDHQKNFDDQNLGDFRATGLQSMKLDFQCTTKELAHLLFSVEEWHSVFAPNKFAEVCELLEERIGPNVDLTANAFYSVYYR